MTKLAAIGDTLGKFCCIGNSAYDTVSLEHPMNLSQAITRETVLF